MSDASKIAMLTSQVENFKVQLQKALKFKAWAMSELAKAGIYPVADQQPSQQQSEDFDGTEELFPAVNYQYSATCWCLKCGKAYANETFKTDMPRLCNQTACPKCGTQGREYYKMGGDTREPFNPDKDRSVGLKP